MSEQIKKEKHIWAGQTMKLGQNVSLINIQGDFRGAEFVLEDWIENVIGSSWMENEFTNFACIHYSVRVKNSTLPRDDNVVYGKIGLLGHLIHESELKAVKR